ncbi:peptidylprolyl isomerase [Actinoalloteichus hymeniacidonis]|uniref:Peptidyl-prolyl cis-trans isomerase n=1 Tax=Actinoalloteichus hymeniacidonis TaxID=340345 RepID=A0AAC9HPD2_9PSEU|nr:peptidylprolyl isomerase [Actinoalloteichus hymeniacidonis]AOS62921.1 peptidyl-prolyl cis-trans isomerase (rotamase) - cyclophilin family [Actinoalloteichus hymeniacidonis]MBB5909046.1 peptidyl-prolyl cis-trans isomerase B (cyclophilin B) [Actinoalloteichus hymeniacidonis]
MPTNEQRRAAAKRKLERQLQRRAQRAKRRRTIAMSATVLGTVLVVGLVYFFATQGGDDAEAAGQSDTPETPSSVETTDGPCGYVTSGEPAKEVDIPEDVDPTPAEGTVDATLATNQGEIGLTLDREAAPCTVQSFVHLAESGYFDESQCHRLVTAEGSLEVLQCGDPTGTGSGGPGYEIADELTGEETYGRGTLAMANAGPNTGGSQFFIVYGDSELPPSYTVFGTIDEGGLEVVDGIAEAGESTGQGDGPPNTETIIESASITA